MSETNLTGIIQKIVQECVNGMKPADMMTGTVISVSPLSVQPDVSMPPIPAAALILTSAVTAKTATVQGGEGGTVVINSGLAVGNHVLMLRVSKGNRYIILSTL